jgi:putative sterol carrier protein
MANIDSIEEEMRKRLEGRAPVGKTISFKLKDEGTLRIDARAEPVTLSRSDEASDAALIISADDMAGLLDGSINGQSLMMTGRAKMEGNPMIAMKLRDLLM